MRAFERMLCVDDSSDLGNLLTIVLNLALKIENCEIATDGEEGIKKVSAAETDLVVTDLNMPKMDGLTFLEELASIPSERKRITFLLTGGSHLLDKPENRKRVIQLLKKGHLSGVCRKPLPFGQIAQLIELTAENKENNITAASEVRDATIDTLRKLGFLDDEIMEWMPGHQ